MNDSQKLLGFSTNDDQSSALILWDDREIDFPRSVLQEVLKARAKGEPITIHNNSYAASSIKEVRAYYRRTDVNYSDSYGGYPPKQKVDQIPGRLVKVRSRKTGVVVKLLPEHIDPERHERV